MAIEQSVPAHTVKFTLLDLHISKAFQVVTLTFSVEGEVLERAFTARDADFITAVNWILGAASATELDSRLEQLAINRGWITGTQVPD
jgi:hypothetical protein